MRSLSDVSSGDSAPPTAEPEATPDPSEPATQPKQSVVKKIGGHVEDGQSWVNHFQARHWIIAFPFAVFRKYADDKASRLAAMITYYGFISVFPILLLLVSIAHLILSNNPDLLNSIITTVVPEPLRATVEQSFNSLPSSGIPLLIGSVSLLLAGMGGAFAAYATVTQMMQVPYRKWYGFGPRYVRVILTLFLVIFGAIGLGTLIYFSTKSNFPVLSTPGWAYTITGGFLWLVLFTGIHLLSPRKVPFREIWLGCLLSAAGILALVYLGGRILQALVGQRNAVYGTFSSFIALLAVVFLVGQVLVISAEISTVWAWRLWPRSIDVLVYFDADIRAMKLLANMEERMPRERVSVRFIDDAKDDPDPYLEIERQRGTGEYGRDPWGIRDSGATLESDSDIQDGES